MNRRCYFAFGFLTAVLFGMSAVSAAAEDPVFSGPQVGERLVPFSARGVLGESTGEEFDLVSAADGRPLLLIFVHEVTRPSIGLVRTVVDFAKDREKDGLHSGLVFLTDDPTSTEAFLKRAAHALPRGIPLGISLDGDEGPGAYGLNRNVTLTVLVAKENRITANFALTQPSLAQDGPEIGHAIVKVLGGDHKPTLEELGVRPEAMMRDQRTGREAVRDARFAELLRPVIHRDATPEEVRKAAAKVEEHAKENEAFRTRVGETARRIIDAGRLENYGTPESQDYLKKWAEAFSKDVEPEATENAESDKPE